MQLWLKLTFGAYLILTPRRDGSVMLGPLLNAIKTQTSWPGQQRFGVREEEKWSIFLKKGTQDHFESQDSASSHYIIVEVSKCLGFFFLWGAVNARSVPVLLTDKFVNWSFGLELPRWKHFDFDFVEATLHFPFLTLLRNLLIRRSGINKKRNGSGGALLCTAFLSPPKNLQ